ncbi:MAG: galactose-1-phosphate uridylyltransferase, partial [Chloroflexi bacterium]|nr:galactose-1-phosphate uridylyltransferase [Chloroflexota bacterium]
MSRPAPTPASSGPGSELRRDPLSEEWIIIAPGRLRRPHGAAPPPPGRARPEDVADCPLCPGNEHETPPPVLTLAQPGSAQPWAVRVVPNLYPAVSPARAASSNAGRFFRSQTATGVHELVVETPFHNQELPDREPSTILLDAFQHRLRALEARPASRHVVIFKNKGVDAGTSLPHPHSQIVALDFMPAEVRRRVQVARRYYRNSGGCLLCAVVEEERRAGARVVFERDGFFAFAPYASGSAGETLLVPRTHTSSFTSASSDVCEGLGRSLITLLRRLREAFDNPAYNLVLHTAPKRWLSDPALHWYWQLSPRLTRTAGFELGTGLRVNPMAPEE